MNPNRDTKTIPKKCKHCGSGFLISVYNDKRGRGNYCSQRCVASTWRAPAADRFMDKVEKTDFCWAWTGAKQKLGYGTFGVGSRTDGSRQNVLAHRFSYELHKGKIPAGLHLDHLCRNPNCVRPDHLEPVTRAVNVQRSPYRTKLICKRGHNYVGSNNRFYRKKGGGVYRVCMECARTRARANYARKLSEK